MTIKWEYRIEFCKMPSGFVDRLEKEWTELQANHSEVMNKLGSEGWEYFMNIGPLFYFKRPIESDKCYIISNCSREEFEAILDKMQLEQLLRFR